MPATVADFVKAAEDSGILTADSLAEFLQGVPPETDATALANRLVKAGRLTAFQAKQTLPASLDPPAGRAFQCGEPGELLRPRRHRP